jgi:hypothetical protein
MDQAVSSVRRPETAALDVRVDARDSSPLSDSDLRRLFPGSTLTDIRLDRLREWPRVLVRFGECLVGVATYQKTERDLRVPDLGVQPPDAVIPCGACPSRDVLNALLDGLELACLAAGCRRIVISPPAVSITLLERRGYVRINERCAGGWIEKTLA